MVDYMKALQKPFTDLTKLVIGIVLSIIPIVNFLATGFALECSGLGKAGKSDKMPEWKDWGDLFVKGLLSAIIAIIYLLPAIIVATFGVAGLAVGLMQGNFRALGSALVSAAPILMLAGLLFLIAIFLLPMAFLNYIKKRNFAKAFAFGEVVHKCLNANYIVAFIVVFVVTGVAWLILGWIPILGTAILSFVMGVFSFTVFGEVYREVK